MSLVLADTYRTITGDPGHSSEQINQAIADAVSILENVLRRPLEQAERTERLKVRNVSAFEGGRVHPKATPVVSVDDLDIIDDYTIGGVSPDGSIPFGTTNQFATVTYTGGFVERTAEDNADATNKLPKCIEDDLAWAAYDQLNPTSRMQVPVGATAVTVGDASVTFAEPAGPRSSQSEKWSELTLRYKRRFV